MNYWPYTLKTQRLTLRPFKESDVSELYELAKNENIGPCAGWPAHNSVEESLFIIQNVLCHPYTFAVVLTSTNTLIGSCSLSTGDAANLRLRDYEGELGYWIGEPYWGNGYAPEAAAEVLRFGFEDLALQSIWCTHNSDNPKSGKVKAKLGFSPKYEVKNKERPLMHDTKDVLVASLDLESWKRSDRLDKAMIASQQQEADVLAGNIPYISRICSGGQTGADRGGLDAALDLDVNICGWCPKGGLAEDFTCAPGILTMYPQLKEEDSISYVLRTAHNVRDSHATLVVAPNGLEPRSGTEMTVRFANDYKRPVKVVSSQDELVDVATWIKSIGKGITLNIAGPRESKCQGTYQTTYNIVKSLLELLS